MSVAVQNLRVIKSITYAWTSAADQTATEATTQTINGRILRLVTIPSGVAAPTDNYDITVTDSNGVDVLQGLGANRDTANTEEQNIIYSATSVNPVCDSVLTINVSNAGVAKSGTAIVYFEGRAY